MCRLIKYYETDTTIFLLLEYIVHGKLFQHLESLAEQENKSKKPTENQNTLLDEPPSKPKVNRRKSLNLKLNNSFTSLETSSKINRRTRSFRTSLEVDADIENLLKSELKATLKIDNPIKMRISSSSSSSTSSDSNELAAKNVNKKETSKCDQEKASHIPSDSSSTSNESKKKSKRVSPIVFLSNVLRSSFKKEPKPVVPAVQINDEIMGEKPLESKFVIETRKWLAFCFSYLRH